MVLLDDGERTGDATRRELFAELVEAIKRIGFWVGGERANPGGLGKFEKLAILIVILRKAMDAVTIHLDACLGQAGVDRIDLFLRRIRREMLRIKFSEMQT